MELKLFFIKYLDMWVVDFIYRVTQISKNRVKKPLFVMQKIEDRIEDHFDNLNPISYSNG